MWTRLVSAWALAAILASSHGQTNSSSTTTSTTTEAANSTRAAELSLQDLSNHDDIEPPSSNATCVDGDVEYRPGSTFNRSCEETCVCGRHGEAACRPRCKPPTVRKGKTVPDPLCFERTLPEDPCCALLVCAQDTEPEPLEGCIYKNQTYQRGDLISDGCESVCTCADGGNVTCKPRCQPVPTNSSDHCVTLPDPNDKCCMVVRCDVTLNDQDVQEPVSEEKVTPAKITLLTPEIVNSTAVILKMAGDPPDNFSIEISDDQKMWKPQKSKGVLVFDLMPGHTYYLRLKSAGATSNIVDIQTPKSDSKDGSKKQTAKGCQYRGKMYAVNEEFHDGCEAYCACTETGEVECATIECPTDFGLDVIDPHCLEWDFHPAGFVPTPPNCCPDEVKCIRNGSCTYMGETFHNWAEIPSKLTGCDKKCYCEIGNVTCQNVCPPVPKTPPSTSSCPAGQLVLSHIPEDNCCMYWVCQPPESKVPDELLVKNLEAVDDTTVRVVFSVPQILVGLLGRIHLRYTSDSLNDDISTWNEQMIALPNDLIATAQLEFTLGGLKPDTEYKIRIAIEFRDVHNYPTSPVLTVRTLQSVSASTLPPIIEVYPNLRTEEVNSTWVVVAWDKLVDFELKLVDGIQLRYKERNAKVPSDTPLIHRAVTKYTLEKLKPSTDYEIGIFFIPFPGQTTELQDYRKLYVTTLEAQDMYNFNISLGLSNIKSYSVEVTWSGVPYPEDKYVHVYQVIYQSDISNGNSERFKTSKRDSQPKVIIADLKPGTRYRLWLQAYLSNGKTKISDVKDFRTLPGSLPEASRQGGDVTDASTEAKDYYSPLVAVAIVAAVAILVAVILFLILLRKHGQNKAAISTSRKAQSAYDNPSYKTCENDQTAANGSSNTKTTSSDPA